MPRKHVVKVGESAPQIAARFGFEDWKTIYRDAENAELRQKRKDPNTVFPGDEVAIPTIEQKVFKLETGKKHRVVIPRPRAKLKSKLRSSKKQPGAAAAGCW